MQYKGLFHNNGSINLTYWIKSKETTKKLCNSLIKYGNKSILENITKCKIMYEQKEAYREILYFYSAL